MATTVKQKKKAAGFFLCEQETIYGPFEAIFDCM